MPPACPLPEAESEGRRVSMRKPVQLAKSQALVIPAPKTGLWNGYEKRDFTHRRW